MDIAIASEVASRAEGRVGDAYRSGSVDRQWLLAGEERDGLNFRLFLSKYNSGGDAFQSPRHHHGFQQIRWTESGSINYGPGQNIADGDLAYFPRGTYYGPQVKDSGVSLLLQFGFGNEIAGKKIEAYREGNHLNELRTNIENLQARGTLADGVFIDVDPATGKERRRDPAEAMAAAQGKKMAISPERYAAPIMMHPQAFTYYQFAPGVELKHLGRFWDQSGPMADIRISELRLSDHGSYHLSGERAQLMWTASPGLVVDGKQCPRLTFLFSPRDEDTDVSGENGVEAFLIEFPRVNG